MRHAAAVLLGCLWLGGCGTVFKDRSQVPMAPFGGFGTSVGSPRTTPPPGYAGKWRNADIVTLDLPTLLDRYSGANSNHNFEAALASFSQIPNAEVQKVGRNEIAGAILMASEKNCEVYVEYLHGNQILIKATSTAAASILSGAATVATPERSSRLLAALAGISTGVGGNLSDAVFSARAVDAIVSGINAERAALKAVLMTNMQKSYVDWPLSVALSDAVTYHSRCNAISGLAFLQGSAEQQKKTAEKTTDKLVEKASSGQAGGEQAAGQAAPAQPVRTGR